MGPRGGGDVEHDGDEDVRDLPDGGSRRFPNLTGAASWRALAVLAAAALTAALVVGFTNSETPWNPEADRQSVSVAAEADTAPDGSEPPAGPVAPEARSDLASRAVLDVARGDDQPAEPTTTTGSPETGETDESGDDASVDGTTSASTATGASDPATSASMATDDLGGPSPTATVAGPSTTAAAATGSTTRNRQTTATNGATTASTTRQTTTTARQTTTTTRQTTTTARQTTTTTRQTTTTARQTTTAGTTCATGAEFELVMWDDFNGSSLGGHWLEWNSSGNAGNGIRRSSAIDVGNGRVRITAQMIDGTLVSGGFNHRHAQTYGRYVFKVRTDVDPSRAMSGVVLTWPQSNAHPRDGENNIYETLPHQDSPTRNPFYSFIHKPFGSHSDQEYKIHRADGAQWQTMSMEWTPGRITITREGPGGATWSDTWTVNETSADLIPDVPHQFHIQLDAFRSSMSGTVTMEVDYAGVYRYCG